MPTSNEEAQQIVQIMNDYLTVEDAKAITERLDREVGTKTDNDSLKVSLGMLKTLYQDVDMPQPKLKRFLLYALIVFHMFVIGVNVSAFFILPFMYPLYVWMPLNSFILITTFTREVCPLTKLENHLRKQLDLPKIGGFVGHYIVRPSKKYLFKMGGKLT